MNNATVGITGLWYIEFIRESCNPRKQSAIRYAIGTILICLGNLFEP